MDGAAWYLDDDLAEWQATMRSFAAREVIPRVASAPHGVDLDLLERIAALQTIGLRVSEDGGGAGAGVTSLCIAVEELARVDSSVAATVHAVALSASLVDHLGSAAQKRAVLPAVLEGRALVCVALTEQASGSEAGNIRTRARRDGSGWVLDGAKQFITNCGTPRSTHVVVFAATGPGSRPRRPEVSAFLVPLDAPGITVGPAYDKLGWRGSDTHPLYFDAVRLDGDALLGEQGKGYREALAFLTWGRLPFCALAVGLAQGCLDATLRFVGERESFGKPLGAHQAIAFDVAQMAGDVAAARALTYDACWRHDHGRPFEQATAIAKMVAPELANRIAYRATQLHGGYGFVEDSPVARHFRDARVLTIGEGTTEMQRLLVARGLGLPA